LLRNDIRFLAAPQSLTLGAMRNLSIEVAQGDVICQWDDDDLYHPVRLSTQYKFLSSQPGVAGTCYSEFLKYFADTNQMYWIDWSDEHPPEAYRFLSGTVMFYKKYFYEYGNMLYPEYGSQSDKEEDLNVLQKLILKGRILAVSPTHHYIYVYHGGNTYDLAHHRITVDTSGLKKMATKSKILRNEKLLKQMFRLVGLEQVEMCAEEGVVFVYKENDGKSLVETKEN